MSYLEVRIPQLWSEFCLLSGKRCRGRSLGFRQELDFVPLSTADSRALCDHLEIVSSFRRTCRWVGQHPDDFDTIKLILPHLLSFVELELVKISQDFDRRPFVFLWISKADQFAGKRLLQNWVVEAGGYWSVVEGGFEVCAGFHIVLDIESYQSTIFRPEGSVVRVVLLECHHGLILEVVARMARPIT